MMPSNATAGLGNNVASAPESISIGTSAMLSPLSGCRRTTLAAGVNPLSSYAGILGFLGNVHREVRRPLWFRQARATYAESMHLFDTGKRVTRTRSRALLIVGASQSLPEPLDLSQALLDRLQATGGMFDVVLDRRLQIVDRCRDRLGLLGEAQLTELFHISLMSHSH